MTPDAAIIDSPPVSGPAATFTSMVTPIVTKSANHCLDAGCHAGTFQPNLSSYDTLLDKYKAKPGATNPMTTKNAPHSAVLSAADKTAIAAWIDSLP